MSDNAFLMARALTEVVPNLIRRSRLVRLVWGGRRRWGRTLLDDEMQRARRGERWDEATELLHVKQEFERLSRVRSPSEADVAAAHADLKRRVASATPPLEEGAHHHCRHCGWATASGDEVFISCVAEEHEWNDRECNSEYQRCRECGVIRCGADLRPPQHVSGVTVGPELEHVIESAGWLCVYCDREDRLGPRPKRR